MGSTVFDGGQRPGLRRKEKPLELPFNSGGWFQRGDAPRCCNALQENKSTQSFLGVDSRHGTIVQYVLRVSTKRRFVRACYGR